MAFPTTSVLDNFTGTSGTNLSTYSTSWSVTGGIAQLQISTNAATGTISGTNVNYWNVANYGPDCEAFYLVSTKSGNGAQDGVLARLVGEGSGATVDGYYVSENPAAGTDAVRINRLDNGVLTQLGTDLSQEIANGDSLGLEISVTTLTAYYKSGAGAWASLGTRGDATYSLAGKLGVLASNTGCRMDDFGGGTIVVAGDVNRIRFPSQWWGMGVGGQLGGSRTS